MTDILEPCCTASSMLAGNCCLCCTFNSHHKSGAQTKNVADYYRPYPRTCNCEITSFTSGWQIAKGGKDALFYSRIAVNDGKGRRVQ